jgi:hypothetical protein
LGFDPTDGTLYGVNGRNANMPNLFTVNVATGQATVVGRIGSSEHDFAGIAFTPDGQMYGLDHTTNALWQIDKTNPSGAATVQVGTGLGGGISLGDTGGLARDSETGIVYGFASGSGHLFSVDLATGLGTVLHSIPTPSELYSLAIRYVPSAIEPSSWGSVKSRYRH